MTRDRERILTPTTGHSPDMIRMWEMEMMMHQKYTAKSMIAPRGGAPGMLLRTAGRANSTETAPVTNAATSTCNRIGISSESKTVKFTKISRIIQY